MPRYAAVDVGSNSVRMLAAEVNPGKKQATVLAADRQVTRLGESVFRSGRIANDAMQFVCEQLARMAQTYNKLDVVGVRAVATSAVRDASNQHEFLERASESLGTPLEIISGQEEARLIHLGVQWRWPHPGKRVLMVDVGGGSAEVMLGDNGALAHAFSKPLGAVRLTEVFLKSDPPAEQELRRMHGYIDQKLETPLEKIGTKSFDRAVVTSATAAAIVCAINRIPREHREDADRLRARVQQVKKFYDTMCGMDLARRRKLPGIGPRRAEIIIAGTAVFLRILQLFQQPGMYYSAAGVRDGIIADLDARGVGRELSQLSRDQRRVVEQMARRYGVPLPHARQVASLGHELFEALQPLHKLPAFYGKLLEASAYLHDIGHYVSGTSHHKHSAYFVENSDMPGFTDSERHVIAMLCRYHRKSMPQPRHMVFHNLPADTRRALLLLTPILRLADSLDRGQQQRVDGIRVNVRNGNVAVSVVSAADPDLELWAAERASDAFRDVYEIPLALGRAK